jgi:hypothetical protein
VEVSLSAMVDQSVRGERPAYGASGAGFRRFCMSRSAAAVPDERWLITCIYPNCRGLRLRGAAEGENVVGRISLRNVHFPNRWVRHRLMAVLGA